MGEFEFKPWPKIPRLNRSMIITEKIDGTNACVYVSDEGWVGAQSRNKIITPDRDNAGFAKWVYENAGALMDVLGPGYHYGEWWGSGIQRGYGLDKGEKRFSLFNTERWSVEETSQVDGMGVVPVLYRGDFSTETVNSVVDDLRVHGSYAASFDRPEGVIVYLPAANAGFKVTVEGDGVPKSVSAA